MLGIRVAGVHERLGCGNGVLVSRFRLRPVAEIGLDVARFDEGRNPLVLQIGIVPFLVHQLLIELVGRLQEIAPQLLQPLGLQARGIGDGGLVLLDRVAGHEEIGPGPLELLFGAGLLILGVEPGGFRLALIFDGPPPHHVGRKSAEGRQDRQPRQCRGDSPPHADAPAGGRRGPRDEILLDRTQGKSGRLQLQPLVERFAGMEQEIGASALVDPMRGLGADAAANAKQLAIALQPVDQRLPTARAAPRG